MNANSVARNRSRHQLRTTDGQWCTGQQWDKEQDDAVKAQDEQHARSTRLAASVGIMTEDAAYLFA